MTKENIKIKILRAAVFLFLLTWCLGFAGFLLPHDTPFSILSYPVFKQIYSNVCHQDDFKTINDLDFNLFVCARCTGIYLSCLSVSILSLFVRWKTDIYLSQVYMALILIFTDIIFVAAGLYEYSKLISFLTGSLLGFVMFLFFLEIIENTIGKISVVRNNA